MKLRELPDFEDMFARIEKIRELNFKKLSLEAGIKDEESRVARTVNTDPQYFASNGKPHIMSYIKVAWLHTGLDGEITPLRIEYARTSSELEKEKSKLFLERELIGVWRTQQADKRLAVE
jgi:hypothetical protein